MEQSEIFNLDEQIENLQIAIEEFAQKHGSSYQKSVDQFNALQDMRDFYQNFYQSKKTA